MVMHARKTQRMNDGYFEKHQAHPYQNSKYSSSKSYGSSSDRYDRIRDSPNGTYRSDSPDSQSPRDRERSYQSKSSYLQKIREKERENRDYKMSRDKYSDCARSPKDKRSRDSEHRLNNDRNDEKGILHPIRVSQNLSSRDKKPVHNNCAEKRGGGGDDRERVIRVGDWSEHVSSSGKKYYYNCKTEVSQWEKPREWVERGGFRSRERERERDRESERDGGRGGGGGGYGGSSRSSGMRHEKHSNSRGGNSGGSNKDRDRDRDRDRESASASRHWSSGSSKEDSDAPPSRPSSRKHPEHENNSSTMAAQDMDISPGDSTPTSEVEQGGGEAPVGPVLLANALPRLISHPIMETANSASPGATPSATALPGALPRMLSQPAENAATVAPVDKSASAVHTCLSVDTNHTVGSCSVVEGPPTPTHSETPDCANKVVAVPTSSPSGVGGVGGSVVVAAAVSLGGLRAQGPSITPSLGNHYRDDLVNHVRGWPADLLEKQAQKLAEEAHLMGSVHCSKVSAELKSARSIVRLTEIQATLQEQRLDTLYYIDIIHELNWLRFCLVNNVKCENITYLKEGVRYFEKTGTYPNRILFLRQQIKQLEELKSQNSFMSDDS